MKIHSLQTDKRTVYPIILVHGIILKDIAFFKAFGRIEKHLRLQGYKVYTAKIDGFGTIENNATQLKTYIDKILIKENCVKVNLIAHSKGGLDSKYMIEHYDAQNIVASLTTLCTPHKGSPIASWILRMPKPIVKFIAFWINLTYKIFGDKHPNSLEVCKQLQLNDAEDFMNISDRVYCQSYSSTLEKSRDDFIMGIPLMFSKHLENIPTDGLVSVNSSKFGEYKGNIDGSVSHSQIVDFMVNKKKKERILAFYSQICNDLNLMGF